MSKEFNREYPLNFHRINHICFALCRCEESTASDYVEFSNFMTVDRKFRKMCETNKRAWDVRSDGRFFRVTFRSNDRFESTGFRASYQFQSEPPSTTETPAMSVSEQFNGNGSTICKCLIYFQCFFEEKIFQVHPSVG